MNLKTVLQRCSDIGYFKVIAYVILLFVILFFTLRNSLVRVVFNHKCSVIENKYSIDIKTDRVGFSGLSNIYIENLLVKPVNRDTLFSLKRAEVRMSFLDLIFAKVNPLEVWLSSPKINLNGNKKSSNYLFLLGPKTDSLSEKSLAYNDQNNQNSKRQALYRLIRAMFGLTTAKYHISDLALTFSDSSYNASISTTKFESSKKGFDSQLTLIENGTKGYIHLSGLTDKHHSSILFNISMIGGKRPLPILNHKLGLNLAFDTLNVKLEAKELNSNSIQLNILSSVSSLEVFSQRLSDQTVKVNRGGFNIDVSINPDYYQIDSTSSFSIDGINAKLFVEYIPKSERKLLFKLSTDKFQTQKLFDALPEGLFTNLRGIKANGTIEYRVDFRVNLDKPDSVYLKPKLVTKDFYILQYGNRNFANLNDTFSQDVYDEGRYIKTIHIGSRNKNFRTFNQISPLIVDAVITSEDGGFFNSNGFDIDALKYAISENIKQKRFARGGSTITMQLIKNLYLSKNKNLFRKAEEYMIVWLIESQQIVPKERQLEIYLNIIEWGPNIYGVTEACRYYFGKDPKDVNLDEAIYLASIIPRPKKVKWLFEKDGNLKSFMEQDFKFVATKMVQRGMITEDQFNSLTYNVNLSDQAKKMFNDTTTSMPYDSIFIDEVRLNSDTTLLLH